MRAAGSANARRVLSRIGTEQAAAAACRRRAERFSAWFQIRGIRAAHCTRVVEDILMWQKPRRWETKSTSADGKPLCFCVADNEGARETGMGVL